MDEITLVFAPGTLPPFARLFSDGVVLTALTGCSLKEFLCGQLGIDPEYLTNRIQTIFLNGKPVDDCESAHVTDGSVVALSAAMPGLAGATLRCGGVLAAMRGAITHQDGSTPACDRRGTITLKLFNLLIPEIGPQVLAHGIRLDKDSWQQLLDDYRGGIQSGCRQLYINGTRIDTDQLVSQLSETDAVLLKITAMGSELNDVPGTQDA